MHCSVYESRFNFTVDCGRDGIGRCKKKRRCVAKQFTSFLKVPVSEMENNACSALSFDELYFQILRALSSLPLNHVC